ncbi:MAG: tetratricopeptide repeat protein [Acidobacteriota bacterium]
MTSHSIEKWVVLTVSLVLALILSFISGMLLIGAVFHDSTGESREMEEKYEGANKLFQNGRFDEAMVLLKELLAVDDDHHDAMVLLGWSHYRKGDFKSSEQLFTRAYKKFPKSTDVLSGLAYSKLQTGKLPESEQLFQKILESQPESSDAMKGLGIVKKFSGNFREAKTLFDRALILNPEDCELRSLREQIAFLMGSGEDVIKRGPLSKEIPIKVNFKAGKEYFAANVDGGWKDIFIKGVNIGVALPGKFPAEFPMDKELYLDWLHKISEMNANAVRVYTLLPPVFYRALKEHNEKAGVNRLWLIQGVWVELPPENDFYDQQFINEFKADIARVIDAVHGNIEIALRPGHAHGEYDADVSEYLLAMILGREWEPFSVIKFNDRYPDRIWYNGEYFRVEKGNPLECWMAEICNFTAAYESEIYRMQHPLAYSSWPTLDPIHHPTETSKIEENEIKRRLGLKVDPVKGEQYDDDAVSVDATHIIPTEQMIAGFFASYHIYPYHPDFLNNDPGYSKAEDSEGRNNYLGYLKDLKNYHKNQPLLVAEFGVPTSRGISHFQSQRFNHGGHTEIEQGRICRRLMKNIVDTKCAGGIVFSWIDEWFKKNWLTVDFENPLERNPLWYNAIDPEQNYGLLAMKPGRDGWKVSIDGKPDDWKTSTPLYVDDRESKFSGEKAESSGDEGEKVKLSVRKRFGDGFDAARDLKQFYVTCDEGYLYLRIDLGSLDCNMDGKADWEKASYFIGIDSYRSDLGDFRFPPPADVFTPSGMEFMIELKGEKESRIHVDEPYSTFIHTAEGWGPYRSLPNRDGKFIEIKSETNRERYGRDGTVYHAISYSKSPLRFGSMERGSKDYDSLADWYLNLEQAFIEVRIPWGLLNVTDPSSKRVLHQEGSHLAPLDTVRTEGFHFYVTSINPSEERDAVADTFPPVYEMGRKGLRSAPLYDWKEWEIPHYHSYLKDSYFILKDDFSKIKTYIME